MHLDLLGSVIVPALLFFSPTNFIFGWAKPVPYNPYNLRDQKWGEALVAVAGPAINLVLASIFAIMIRLAEPLSLSASFIELASYVVFINILLAFFNLSPFPPLDGSKILPALLPYQMAMSYRNFTMWVERNGLLVMLLFIFIFINILWIPFSHVVFAMFELMTGLGGL